MKLLEQLQKLPILNIDIIIGNIYEKILGKRIKGENMKYFYHTILQV